MIRPYLHYWLLLLLPFSTFAQSKSKQPFVDVRDALLSAGQLIGETGPQSVNWIDGGERFSYIEQRPNGDQVIKAYDPATQQETLIFDAANEVFPDSGTRFTYQSFQWSQDSKYLLFQTNFRPVWRNSGMADYYYYSVADGTLQLVVKDARTAQVSPNGQQVAFERNGNLFAFDFATQQETQLTSDANEAEYIYNGRFGWVYEEEFGLTQAWGLVARQPLHRLLADRRIQGANLSDDRLRRAASPLREDSLPGSVAIPIRRCASGWWTCKVSRISG